MNFFLICRHKGADYRSSVYQREVENLKHTAFISFLKWSNAVALFYTDLQIYIFFCQLFNVRLKDLDKKLTTLNHLWNVNPVHWLYAFSVRFSWFLPIPWDLWSGPVKIFSATVLIMFWKIFLLALYMQIFTVEESWRPQHRSSTILH